MRRFDPFQVVALIVLAALAVALLTGCGGYAGGYYDPPVIVYTHVHHYIAPHVHVHVYHSYGFRRR